MSFLFGQSDFRIVDSPFLSRIGSAQNSISTKTKGIEDRTVFGNPAEEDVGPEAERRLLPSIEEILFDKRVDLKVLFSTYSMHLSKEERRRTFDEIDYLLDAEGWEADFELPQASSFVGFVKWIVFAEVRAWSSLGIGVEGNILAAWHEDQVQLTANFGETQVSWTAQIKEREEWNRSAGVSTYSHFARVAKFHLGG